MTANDERVVGIDGKPHREPPVTQLHCAKVAHLQAAAWNMHTEASTAALEIGARLARGAELDPGEWYYDATLHMVRSKREVIVAGPTLPLQRAFDFEGRKEPASEGREAGEQENAG